jgi:hypothetical protein
MPDELTVLAMTGATTIVAAMATSAWQSARSGVQRLFRHGGKQVQAAVSSELDGHAALVARAEDSELARRGLAAAWQVRLADLLRQHPETTQELRLLVDRIGAELPRAEQAWVQTNIARDGGRIFAAQGGDVIVHQAPPGADGR